ncbi:MAG: prolipoprotein diacylglyceryl transferase [Terriglobia bacterium]
MYPILLQIGHFELRSYGIIVVLSFLAGLWLSTKEAARNGLDPALLGEFSFYALLGGIAGARIYFILFSDPLHYLRNPWEILAVWRGGIGVIGSLAGGFLIAVWFCRKKRIPLLKFADVLAPAVALGQTLGQFACLANGDSYGRPADLPWAITYTDPRSLAPLNVPLHPIEIYEMGAYFLVFLVVWMTRKRFKVDGFSFLVYLAAYGVARFLVEFFRDHPAVFAGGIPAAQVVGVVLMLASFSGFFWIRSGRNAGG